MPRPRMLDIDRTLMFASHPSSKNFGGACGLINVYKHSID